MTNIRQSGSTVILITVLIFLLIIIGNGISRNIYSLLDLMVTDLMAYSNYQLSFKNSVKAISVGNIDAFGCTKLNLLKLCKQNKVQEVEILDKPLIIGKSNSTVFPVFKLSDYFHNGTDCTNKCNFSTVTESSLGIIGTIVLDSLTSHSSDLKTIVVSDSIEINQIFLTNNPIILVAKNTLKINEIIGSSEGYTSITLVSTKGKVTIGLISGLVRLRVISWDKPDIYNESFLDKSNIYLPEINLGLRSIR
jgi:hypothetical protein